jgi:hypothetical protein
MIISPPFLTDKNTEKEIFEEGMQLIPSRDSSSFTPEGNFPVSRSFIWHTGLHFQAPRIGADFAPVRAIADGTVVFVNQPRPKVDDPNDGQAYNPYGEGSSWTDNGMVIVKHETDIGAAGDVATSITYYSSYMHLAQIESAVIVGKKIYRKDKLGKAGLIYGREGSIEVSICCDAGNLEKIIGRKPEWKDPATAPTKDGRTDAVFGNVYIYLPATTKISTGNVMPTIHRRSTFQGTAELGEAQWVKLDYGHDGVAQGSCVLTSYSIDGVKKGACVPEVDCEYKLDQQASKRHATGTANSSPSGWYELLRFGRNIGRGPDAADKDSLPDDAMHWRKIKTVAGADVWADLNAPGSYKFSDADFLPIMGWNCYDDDDQPDDQRCTSSKLKALVADPQNPESVKDESTLGRRIGIPDILLKLSQTICKFPNEWDKATIETRYKFVKERPDFKDNPESWDKARKHLEAIGIDGLPDEFKGADWHFHPVEFVRHFAKCGWLKASELAQCFPRKHLTLHGTSFVSSTVTWQKALTQSNIWTLHFNRATRKYGLAKTKQRLVHFFSHVIPETGFLTLMKEGGNASGTYLSSTKYYPYYGRGLIQLTWEDGYKDYGKFRNFPRTLQSGPYEGLGWNPDTMIALNNTTYNAPNCADSACWFVIGKNGMLKKIDNGIAQSDAIAVGKCVNGEVPIQKLNGLEVRLQSVLFLRDALLNRRSDALIETMTFNWRRNSEMEPNGQLNAKGNPIKEYIPRESPWVIQVPLDKQRP